MRDWIDEMGRVAAGKNAMIEAACRYVIGIGYRPNECLIETQRVSDKQDRDRLIVRGRPFFELVTDRESNMDSLTIKFMFTPRVIDWPPIPDCPDDAPAAASTLMIGQPA